MNTLPRRGDVTPSSNVDVTHTATYPSAATRLFRAVRRNLVLILLAFLLLTGVPQVVLVSLFEEFIAGSTVERESMVSALLTFSVIVIATVRVLGWSLRDTSAPDVVTTFSLRRHDSAGPDHD